MIIVNGALLHSITTVLTFGSNSNKLTPTVLQRFVNGYSIMEKIQMVGFFIQELILSVIYIRETIRLLRLGESVQDDVASFDDGTSQLRNLAVRKTMYQILAINVIIIIMDLALLGVEFANLYLIETTLKGAVYSIKLKLEFAVLGKLVQIVKVRTNSKNSPRNATGSNERRAVSTGLTLENTKSGDTSRDTSNGSTTGRTIANPHGSVSISGVNTHSFPDFVDPGQFSGDFTHARADVLFRDGRQNGWENTTEEGMERWRRRSRVGRLRGSWIDEEMDKHNIG
jgi:Na+-translocating ferredoxin:NAD+ oxidoreductase RnfA subunit